MENKISVGILGATGSVGQKFIELLTNHPWFEITELGASDRSAGKKYSEATNWNMSTPLDERIGSLIVKKCNPNFESKIIFSGMDASVAGEIEENFAKEGYFVISNARNHRFDKDVPLIIPEANHDHLPLIKKQNWKGAIITNPNCSTIGLVLALKPLADSFGLEKVNVVTMQAISGGGYPGIPSMDMLDNVVPFIGGEEAKMESEPLKILGDYHDNEIINAKIKLSAQCNRVHVLDGHLECVQVSLKTKTTLEEVKSAFSNFTSLPQELNLPSAPKNPILYFEEDQYPQPRIHRNLGNGMSVSVGRLREDSLFDFKFVVLSHNTIRGAAGGTILIAELLKAQNYLDGIL
ncbi:MAG: aspartate-semialdehyde dehydrogenase [Melioribacteraceae bacterium]|nr:aspartate-semialdehyde dehydrogenase [Melioribacteraceae bacterium]MCF8264904.1 aspartate-semialdehyde dehydrogenase [Melioribacteraceae bacterium]MCF8432165.1 aspartate-semialdehyde dehydrogenase [Melioribacteraceae bacterium]